MNSFVYILYSEKDKGYYVGSTRNLEDRIKRHLEGRSLPTKGRLPLKLVYKEIFPSYSDAAKREIYIKKQKSKKFIERVIEIGAPVNK
jgi:putative endonuclease